MRHVAEGDLHAYLDGALEFYPVRDARRIRAHLDRCEGCRRRLEVESALVESSQGVLAAAAPAVVSPPPFESLRRRAEDGTAAAPPQRAGGGAHRAWAAAVVLALGVGWAVGARLQAPERAPQPEGGSVAATQGARVLPGRADPGVDPAPAPSEAEPGPGPASQPWNAESRFAGASPVADPEPLPGEPREERGGTRAAPEGPAMARTAILPGIERRRPPPSQPITLPVTPPARDELVALASRIEPRAVAPRTADAGDGEAESERGAGRPRSEAPARTGVPVPASQGSLPAPSTLASARSGGPLGGALDLFRGGSRAVTLPGSPVEGGRERPDEARTVSAPLSLPGVSVESVEWTEAVAGQQGIRVLQRLEDGTPVELRFLGTWLAGRGDRAMPPAGGQAGRASDAPRPPASLREPLPDGWSQVERPFREGWVLIRGPLPEARLRALLETAAAARRN